MLAPCTLKQLRRIAPPQDRNLEALKLPAALPYQFEKRTEPTPYPTEALAALHKMAGPLGDAAVEEAKWSAINVWLLCHPQVPLLTNTRIVAQLASRCCREARWIMAGWPSLSGKPYVSLLTGQTPETIGAAWGICADTKADWERSRSPRLVGAIRRVSSYLSEVRKAGISFEVSRI